MSTIPLKWWKVRIQSIAWSPDASSIAYAVWQKIAVIDARTERVMRRFNVDADHLRFTPDNGFLVAVGSKEIVCWNVRTWRRRWRMMRRVGWKECAEAVK
jgi:hypothetical protein